MQENSQDTIIFPEQFTRRKLNSLYREIPLSDPAFRLLRKYFSAMANLYGRISLKKAKEIIFEQNPTLVSEEAFLKFAQIAVHENEYYYIMSEGELFSDRPMGEFLDKFIISDFLFIDEDLDLYIDIAESQNGKPYYIPQKAELLKYADIGYTEDTPEKAEFVNTLISDFGIDTDDVECIVENVRYTNSKGDMEDIIELVEEHNLNISKKRMDKLTAVYTDFKNNSRKFHNRGFTPIETSKKYAPNSNNTPSITIGENMKNMFQNGEMSVDEMRNKLIDGKNIPDAVKFDLLKQLSEISPVAKEQKIGRNQLCPCGSGKKYKKCCGR